MEPRATYTERDLRSLIGIPESMRLEFKSARLLLNKEKAVPELSKTVSAFANSEGGTIVIGIAERVVEGNRRVAKEIDGIERELVSPEWLEQVIRSNVSPALPGIRVHEVTLTGEGAGRAAFVVVVPAGSTAYQANSDRRYYGRQEFSVEPLPDHEVRLRMARGRIPRLHLEPVDPRVVTAAQEYAERQGQLARYHAQTQDDLEFLSPDGLDCLKSPKRTFDEYSLQLVVQNIGEITILDFMLSLEWVLSPEAVLTEPTPRFRFDTGKRRMVHGSHEYDPPVHKLFPGERMPFPETRLILRLQDACSLFDARMLLHWTAYLDDAPPSKGDIDIGSWFSQQG